MNILIINVAHDKIILITKAVLDQNLLIERHKMQPSSPIRRRKKDRELISGFQVGRPFHAKKAQRTPAQGCARHFRAPVLNYGRSGM